ncbi:TonB-dependent receptor [Paracoccus aminophilus]|nr:TonB-dependent receptor [Paracoccus aminophilus]
MTRTRTSRAVALLLTGSVSLTALVWPEGSGVVAQEAQGLSFDIPAQSLPRALNAFAQASGWSLGYSSATVSGRQSAPVQGRMRPEAALRALLAGTGLELRVTGPATAAILPAASTTSANEPGPDGAIVLNKVTITAVGGTPSREDLFRVPGSVDYVSDEDLNRRALTSVADLFRTTPGVMTGDGRNSAAIDANIRGVQGMNRNQVRVDGMISSTPNYRGYFGVANRTYVDPDLLAGMEITKGQPNDAAGAGVIGGAVRMRTINASDILLDGRDRGFRLTLGAGTNTASPPAIGTRDKRLDKPGTLNFGTFNGSLAYAQRFGTVEMVAALSRRTQGNYFTGKHGKNEVKSYQIFSNDWTTSEMSPVPRESEALNTQRETVSGLFKLRGEWGDGHSAELVYSHSDSKFGEVMPSQITRFGWNTVEQQDPNKAVLNGLNLTYRWQPEGNDLIDLKASVWATHMKQHTRTGQALVYDPNDYFRARFPISSDYLGIELQNTSHLETGLGPVDLRYGGSYLREETTPKRDDSFYIPPNGIRWERSAFFQADWQAAERLKLRAGLRYTSFDTRDRVGTDTYLAPQMQVFCAYYGNCNTRLGASGWSKNFGLSYELNDQILAYANYDEGYRGPSLMEAAVRYDWLPNPFVTPERSKNVEIGMNYRKAGLLREGDQLLFKTSYFRNHIKDYIVRQTISTDPRTGQPYPGGTGSFIPWNIGKAKFEGVEAALDYDAGRWFLRAGATRYIRVNYCGVYLSKNFAPQVFNPGCIDYTLPDDYAANQIPPAYSGNLTLGARLLDDKLTLGTTITRVGGRAAPAGEGTNGFLLPLRQWNPYTTVDLFASYRMNERMVMNFSAENVTNRYYVDALGLAALPAPGRTLHLGLEAKF